MKKTDAWMPLYIGDYLADTSRLTTEQHGAYLLLLMDYWRNGPPPDDDAVLASIVKLTLTQWKRHAPALRTFFVIDDGRWLQRRADAERAKANGVSDTRRAAGKAGAEARWANGKESGNGNGKQIANAMANVSQSPSQNDTPSQSQSEEKEITEPSVLVPGTSYRAPPSPNSEIVELYRKHLPQLPGVEVLNDSRKRAIAARWREVCTSDKLGRTAALEWFDWYFAHVAKSKFLTGQIPGKSGRIWQADFDFLMNASKFPRVVEGSYHKDAA